MSGRLLTLLSGVLAAAAVLGRIAARDLLTLIAAGARAPHEPRGAALGRARAAASQLRQCRELVYALPEPARRTGLRWRVAGLLAGAALLVLAVRVGPDLAREIGTSTVDVGRYIAGALDGLAGWWGERSLLQQVLLGAAFAGLVVLSGGSLGLGFGLAGVATLTLDKGEGLADFTRDPVAATRAYASTATPAGVALDAAEFALTFAPGNFAGAAAGGAVRRTVTDFRRDPAVWRAERRDLLRDRGAIDPAAFSRRLDWSDPKVREQWVRDRYADPNRDMLTPSARTGSDGAYQRQVAGPDEVRLLGGNPPEPIWADGLALDPDRVVAVEAKFVTDSRTPMYEGRGSPQVQEMLIKDFDDELDRYARVLADPNNPVERLRIVTNTQAAADYLGARARRLLGPEVDLDVVVQAAT